MASHHDWEEEVIRGHEATKPFAPENGQPLRFKVGEKVLFTNDQGAQRVMKVTGLYVPQPMDAMYARGSRYLVNSSSPWFPVKESSLSKIDE